MARAVVPLMLEHGGGRLVTISMNEATMVLRGFVPPWLELRRSLPVGALFCVLRGPTRGRPCAPAGIRGQLRHAAEAAGVRRRFAPHQLRHAHAVEMSREAIALLVIQRQLGHADLAITSAYLRGIDSTEVIQAVHERPAPMIPAGQRLAPRR